MVSKTRNNEPKLALLILFWGVKPQSKKGQIAQNDFFFKHILQPHVMIRNVENAVVVSIFRCLPEELGCLKCLQLSKLSSVPF